MHAALIGGAAGAHAAAGEAASERDIAAILGGGQRRPADPAAFVRAAQRHGVGPLLVHAGGARDLPEAARAALLDEARRQAVRTAVRERELRRVLEALGREGVGVLLIKGAHLSATCYPESWLRLRDDTDLLARPVDQGKVRSVLDALGYRPLPSQTGETVLGQTLFDRPGSVGAALDVHWRIAAPPAAAAAFDIDDLLSRAVAIPRLGPWARGPSRPDALGIACLHQAAHHPDHDLMLWAYDVHLLVDAMSAAEVEAFTALASSRQIAAVCAAGIERARDRFGGSRGAALVERLRRSARQEPTAALLRPAGRLRGLAPDLRAVRGWRGRVRLAAGHLFPPPAFMRTTVAPGSRAPLPWLYLRRLLRAGRRPAGPR